ncbi:hypothetical protein [Thiomicrorhabdus sp.]|uniref:hypothetical protein n=1 Tax=Thiomicrorhabdus sp. TaxID=2039724 RepID=UPI0029C723F0|nr:hypothetical protein [Thiomicrorhabdus sp.]
MKLFEVVTNKGLFKYFVLYSAVVLILHAVFDYMHGYEYNSIVPIYLLLLLMFSYSFFFDRSIRFGMTTTAFEECSEEAVVIFFFIKFFLYLLALLL